MENNSWRPSGGTPTNDNGDWRGQLPPDSRQKVVNKIIDAFKRLLPFSIQEELRTAVCIEENIYSAATSEFDYIRRLCLMMLTMKNMSHSQNAMPNSANGNKPSVPRASHSMQPQAHNQGQLLPIPLPANQSQGYQRLLSQNMQHNMTSSTGVPSSVGLQTAVAFGSGLTQTSIPNASRQNPTMQNIVSVPQNTLSNAIGQNVRADVYGNAQGQMPGRQQVVPQQQPQSQNPQFLYQQQMIMKQKLQQGNPQRHMLRQPKVPRKQQTQCGATNLLPSQGQHSQPQPPQQQLTSQIQSQPAQLQQQLGLRQKSKPSQRDIQDEHLVPCIKQRMLWISKSNDIKMKKQLYQNGKAIQETPSSPEGAHRGSLTTASGKSSVTEQPLERLIKTVKSMSPDALSASVNDIGSVIGMIDRIAGSAPVNGSRGALGEDLAAMTNTRDGMTGSRKMKCYTSAMPMNVLSSAGSGNDSFKRLICPETSDLESTATSSVKRLRIEVNHALLEDIREINQRLIDTVVDVSDEDIDRTAAAAVADGGGGTIVKCSFSAVAMCPSLKSQYFLAQMSPIQPLRLLVPKNYPNCSLVLLDKFPVEVSKEYEDFSIKTMSKFSIFLRSLSQPMTLAEIARTWDVCARAVISEHVQQSGGGTFCSKYGTWENCAA